MRTLKTAEELVIKHAISKNFYGYGNGKFHCQIHYPELCKIITEDRQSITNKIRGMKKSSVTDYVDGHNAFADELIQWIEGGTNELGR